MARMTVVCSVHAVWGMFDIVPAGLGARGGN